MKWFGRIWSKIWVEQNSYNVKPSPRSDPSSSPSPSPQNSLVLNTDFFDLVLSEEWRQIKSENSDQYCFRQEENDIDLVISWTVVDIPANKLKDAADTILLSIVRALKTPHSRRGILQSEDCVTEQSWGHQASVTRVYDDYEVYRFFGMSTPKMFLNITFEGKLSAKNTFDVELEKVMSLLRFSEAVWGGRDFPEGSLLQ